jgi:2-phosphosulfolactate phosphatase
MDIKIKYLVDGVKNAEGMVIIIDVLRACTTIPILFHKGAKEIIPVSSIEEVERFEKEKFVLVGEGEAGSKHGAFHHNNSPSEVYKEDFTGKSIVLRSNNATQAINNSEKADEVILASFVNLDAVVSYVKNQNTERVNIVALGRLGKRGLEDDLCAEAIKLNLKGKSFDFKKMKKKIHICKCAVLVRETLGKPEDVEMALKLNSYPVVPRIYVEDKIKFIKPYFEV